MNEFDILKNLPAPLGFAGLLVYQILRSFRQKNPVVDRILDKIRRDSPTSVEPDQRLSPRQVEGLLRGDQRLQKIAGGQDYNLLQQILKQDFIISLLVIAGALIFGTLTIALWVVPNLPNSKLVLSNFAAVSADQVAKGLLVDLDPIDISWQSSGKPEDLHLYLENLDTHVHSVEMVVPADAHRIEFSSEQYRPVLTARNRNGINRVRIVAQTKSAVFLSDPFDLRVGVTVLTVVDSHAMLTVAAMIDHRRVPFYGFEARILIPSKTASGEGLVVGNEIPYQFQKVKVEHPDVLDWDNARGAYLSPDDPRLVRFEFLVDDAIRAQEAASLHIKSSHQETMQPAKGADGSR